MSLTTDVRDRLISQGVATAGTSSDWACLIGGLSDQLSQPHMAVRQTAGFAPIDHHDGTGLVRPAFQILVRGSTYAATEAKVNAIWTALHREAFGDTLIVDGVNNPIWLGTGRTRTNPSGASTSPPTDEWRPSMGQFGNGVTWSYDATALVGGTPSYTAVAEVYDVSFGGITADTHDVTAHADAWRAFVAGLKDAGEATMSVRMETDDATHKAVLDDVGKGPGAHKFEWPLNVSTNTIPFSIECNAIVTSASPNGPHDDILDLSVTIKFSGSPTITAEAAL